ncbi:MAG: phosphate-starvation-inducible PsiE family protein [Sodalis sp. (in: enterobacteria)]
MLLLMMGMVLLACIAKEIYAMINFVLLKSDKTLSFGVIATLIDYFLYFEFVAIIIKYFESDNFFPLQYFICIGITAMLRLVIVNHEDALSTLWYSFAILIQVIALCITKKEHIQ